MRVLLIRLGVLGTVVVLGWITIAHGQRISGGAADDNPLRNWGTLTAGSSPTASTPTARAPAADPFAPRSTASPSTASAVPAAPATALPIPRSGINFSNTTASNRGVQRDEKTPRYSQTAAVMPLDSSQNGPSLTAADARSANDNRFAPRYSRDDKIDDRETGGGSNRYTVQPVVSGNLSAPDNREPRRFRADPAAMPATQAAEERMNPTRSSAPLSGYATLPPAAMADARPMPSERNYAEPDGLGVPGDAQLEGVQSPRLAIQKFAPKEIQVGKPAAFRVVVRNTGTVPACDVEICDQVPRGARLIATTPQAHRGARGELVWQLGTIQPGDEAKVEMQLTPTVEGKIGSVAAVRFRADASAKSVATRPQLVVEVVTPPKVLIGEQATLAITISNPGTGVATGIVLEEHIPDSLRHPAGSELEYAVGDLKPGESRKLNLPLMAQRAGVVLNVLHARADGNLLAENKCNLEVVAPQLDVAVEGPKRRYLERQATYQLSVANPGTAAAHEIELVATLPPGLKFMSANNAGYYEESTRTVRWRLRELQARESGSVELVTLPIEAGQQAIRLRGTAARGLNAEKEQPVLVEGLAAALFQVSSTADPIAVGGETTYEIRVANQGSKASSNVRLTVDLPRELKPLAAEGPTQFDIGPNRVAFDILPQLAPKAEVMYRVRVKGMKAGDLRASFHLISDDMQTPVTKEESTRVYADD
jgi:uncharacterized repeat protein (TIGR01451 family)